MEVFSRVCPPLQDYSADFRKDLATELAEVVQKYPHVAQVVKDYSVTRDDIRACLRRTTH